jgi:hypothetical protein
MDSTTYNVALCFHLLGALRFVAGIVLAGAAFEAARRRQQPAEIALLLSMTRIGVLVVAVGALLLAAFGLWLVHLGNWGYGTGWVAASMVLYVVALALGGLDGQRPKQARKLPSEQPGELQPPEAGHGGVAADHRHRAPVAVAERTRCRAAANVSHDRARHVAALLHCRRGEHRQLLPVDMYRGEVPDRERLAAAGESQPLVGGQTARAARRKFRDARELGGVDASRPHTAVRAWSSSPVESRTASGVTCETSVPVRTSTPRRSSTLRAWRPSRSGDAGSSLSVPSRRTTRASAGRQLLIVAAENQFQQFDERAR